MKRLRPTKWTDKEGRSSISDEDSDDLSNRGVLNALSRESSSSALNEVIET